MQNQLLVEAVVGGLSGAGLEPLINERVPVNDGGISYGQAAVAAAGCGGRMSRMCLGVPGRIVAASDAAGLPMGTVDFSGVVREVCLAYVPRHAWAYYVIVDVGFAISLVDEAEAQRTLEILRAMGDALEQELSRGCARARAGERKAP